MRAKRGPSLTRKSARINGRPDLRNKLVLGISLTAGQLRAQGAKGGGGAYKSR